MRKFKFTIVETQESKEFKFQYLDFDLIFHNKKFFKIPTDISEIFENLKNVPKFIKPRFDKLFENFNLSDFDNGLDFNYKDIEIFTTPFYLPNEYKHKFVKPFRTITQDFANGLKIISLKAEVCELEVRKNFCDNNEFKQFLLQNVANTYVVEEVQPDNIPKELDLTNGLELVKKVFKSFYLEEFGEMFEKYESIDLDSMFKDCVDEHFLNILSTKPKRITLVDNTLSDLCIYNLGEKILSIDDNKISFVEGDDESIYDIQIDKKISFDFYSIWSNIIRICQEKVSENFKTDFKIN